MHFWVHVEAASLYSTVVAYQRLMPHLYVELRHTRTVRKVSRYQDPPCTVERIRHLAEYWKNPRWVIPIILPNAMPCRLRADLPISHTSFLPTSHERKSSSASEFLRHHGRHCRRQSLRRPLSPRAIDLVSILATPAKNSTLLTP